MAPHRPSSKSTMSRFRIPSAGQTKLALLAVLVGIAACGDDPVAPSSCGSLPQVTVNVGETATVTACFEDVNGDMLTYSVTSSNPSVATATASGPRITVSAIAPGNATVTVTAQDPTNLSGQQSFPVMVPNRPPVPRGSIPSTEVAAGETAAVDASSYFTEPDGEALTYSAVSSDPSVVTVSVGGNTVTIHGVAKGTTNVNITATDPGGLTATQTFQVTVPNQPPRPVGTIPARTVRVGDPATFDVSSYFTDPDGDPLTYTVTSSNSRVATVTAAGANLTVMAIAKGTANVTVTATDSGGLTATQTFQITVPNRAPQQRGTIPAQTITEGRTATVNVSSYFSDPDGDVLTYSAASSNTGVARVSVSGNTVRITAVAPGTANVTVTARDSEGASVQQGFGVTVTRANRAPQRRGTIPAQTIREGRTATVNVSSYFSDPDGDALSYSASSSNTGVARVSVSGSVVTISAAAVGSATVTVTARDPGGLTATQTASVTVNRANRAPQRVGAMPSQTLASGTTATINASRYFSDPDGDVLTYTVSSASSSVVRPSTSGAIVELMAGAIGNTTITVTARDPGGLTATQSARINVVATTFYVPLPELEITLRGEVSLGTVNIGFRCLSTPSGGRNIDGKVYEIHWTEWQVKVKVGGDYRPVSETRKNGQICGRDLTKEPPGEYQIVGEWSVDGSRKRIRSRNRITIGSPDLVFTDVEPERVNVSPGDTVRATFTLRNSGAAESAATTVRAFASDDATISTTDNEVGTSSIRAIAAGEEVQVNLSLSLPSDSSPTTFYAGLCADPVPGESNTANNCSQSLRIVVSADSGSPDLWVGDVDPTYQEVAPGDTATAVFHLLNDGDGPSSPTTVRILVSTDAELSRADREIGTHALRGLRAGEEYFLEVVWVLASNEPLGDFFWGVCIDPVEGESSTTNNCLSTQLVIVAASSSQSSSSVSGKVRVTPGRATGFRAHSLSDWLSGSIIRMEVIGSED